MPSTKSLCCMCQERAKSFWTGWCKGTHNSRSLLPFFTIAASCKSSSIAPPDMQIDVLCKANGFNLNIHAPQLAFADKQLNRAITISDSIKAISNKPHDWIEMQRARVRNRSEERRVGKERRERGVEGQREQE